MPPWKIMLNKTNLWPFSDCQPIEDWTIFHWGRQFCYCKKRRWPYSTQCVYCYWVFNGTVIEERKKNCMQVEGKGDFDHLQWTLKMYIYFVLYRHWAKRSRWQHLFKMVSQFLQHYVFYCMYLKAHKSNVKTHTISCIINLKVNNGECNIRYYFQNCGRRRLVWHPMTANVG